MLAAQVLEESGHRPSGALSTERLTQADKEVMDFKGKAFFEESQARLRVDVKDNCMCARVSSFDTARLKARFSVSSRAHHTWSAKGVRSKGV